MEKCDQELSKLNTQLENAFDLVEQGVYTLDLFKERREKLNASVAQVKDRRAGISAALEKPEANETRQSNLILQTEELLESYDSMTNQE